MKKKNKKSTEKIKELLLTDLSNNIYIEEKSENIDIVNILDRKNELNEDLILLAQYIIFNSTESYVQTNINGIINSFKSFSINRYSDSYDVIIDILYFIFKNRSNNNELIKLLKVIVEFFNETEKKISEEYYNAILYFADKMLVSGDVETSLEYYKLLNLLTHADRRPIEINYLQGCKETKDNYRLLFKYTEITLDELSVLLNSYQKNEIKETLFKIDNKLKNLNSFISEKNINFTSEVREKLFVSYWFKMMITPAYACVYNCGSDQLKKLSSNLKLIKENNDFLNVSMFLANYDESAKLLKDAISLFYCAKEIKNLLIIKDKNKIHNICYYTSLDTFYYLFLKSTKRSKEFLDLEEKARKDIGFLEVMNQSYMNDPSEGEMLFSILGIDRDQKDKRKVLNSNSVYLKSFSGLVDYLPMWNLYGDRGKGVCVVLNADETFNDVDLYNICYVPLNKEISHDDNMNIDDKAIQRINCLIGEIRNICKEHCQNEEFISYVVREIKMLSYLFKSANYSYEKETRFLREQNEIENFIDVSDNYKMLSIKAPFKLNVKELILGPCFNNINMYVPYLDMLLKKLEQQNTIEITMSKIDYR